MVVSLEAGTPDNYRDEPVSAADMSLTKLMSKKVPWQNNFFDKGSTLS